MSNEFVHAEGELSLSDLLKAVEYFNSQLDLPIIPESLAEEATKALTKNNIDIETDHEIRIFNKYVGLGSNRKVAEYYGIPVNHVCNITNKVKKDTEPMKTKILKLKAL